MLADRYHWVGSWTAVWKSTSYFAQEKLFHVWKGHGKGRFINLCSVTCSVKKCWMTLKPLTSSWMCLCFPGWRLKHPCRLSAKLIFETSVSAYPITTGASLITSVYVEQSVFQLWNELLWTATSNKNIYVLLYTVIFQNKANEDEEATVHLVVLWNYPSLINIRLINPANKMMNRLRLSFSTWSVYSCFLFKSTQSTNYAVGSVCTSFFKFFFFIEMV